MFQRKSAILRISDMRAELNRMCVPYNPSSLKFKMIILTNSHAVFFNVSSENLALHQDNITELMIVSILVTCLFDNVLVL